MLQLLTPSLIWMLRNVNIPAGIALLFYSLKLVGADEAPNCTCASSYVIVWHNTSHSHRQAWRCCSTA